jgi:2-C-methyl-D-erythritol 4-phosphate cytidylyltransferase
MNSSIPKQFLLLNGKPVLMHTLEVFHRVDPAIRILTILPADQVEYWLQLCRQYTFNVPHSVHPGGETRFHSVKNNLAEVSDDSLVAVHDGVRPLVSAETVERCFLAARRFGNAIPCLEIPETMRKIGRQHSSQVDRSRYRLIQTPQVFAGQILKKAYQVPYHKDFTDDAGVVERAGYVIHLVEGNPENIKITVARDLQIAQALMGLQR